jgi:hypothetical protein
MLVFHYLAGRFARALLPGTAFRKEQHQPSVVTCFTFVIHPAVHKDDIRMGLTFKEILQRMDRRESCKIESPRIVRDQVFFEIPDIFGIKISNNQTEPAQNRPSASYKYDYFL